MIKLEEGSSEGERFDLDGITSGSEAEPEDHAQARSSLGEAGACYMRYSTNVPEDEDDESSAPSRAFSAMSISSDAERPADHRTRLMFSSAKGRHREYIDISD